MTGRTSKRFDTQSHTIRGQKRQYLNGSLIGTVRAEDGNPNSFYQYSPLSTLQSTLNLKIVDQVWVEITSMSSGTWLYDGGDHLTHFTGFILEEEVVASL